MLRLVKLLCLALAASLPAAAQEYFTTTEVGLGIGASQYFGDLNDNYGLNTLNLGGTIYARKHFTQYIAVRLSGYYTQVGYDDKLNTSQYKLHRNLSFSSDIIEASLQAEFNFFRFTTGDPYHRFTPYLTCGIGAFYYDPWTTYNGGKVSLRQLGTEGQFVGYADRKYGSVSACFPIGVGFKFWLRPGFNLTLEFADRLTVTDYLDDVSTTYVGINKFPTSNPTARALQDRSVELYPNAPLGSPGKQRGNASTRDQYLIAFLSMSWHFITYRCPAGLGEEMIRTY